MTYELHNLSTGYYGRRKTHVVAHAISARLEEGCLTCLLGPNGAGKSTLLRTLANFQPALEGRLLLDGKRLESYSSKEIAQRIGVVLTERPNVGDMTVEELVAMGRSPYTGFWGGLQAEDRAAVDEAIGLADIESLRRRRVQSLSDGERQKTMIAKVLAQQTPIVFLDEPTAFLDFPSKAEMLILLRRLAHEMQKTIFLSTHDIEMALQTADLLWLLDMGSLEIGTPQALAEDGALSRFFSGPEIRFDASNLRFHIHTS